MAPKVISYGLTFFCIKFSIYALLLWMPLFLSQALSYSNTEIANLLTVQELTTLLGTCTIGPLTDAMRGRRSPILMSAICFSSIVCLYLTIKYEELSKSGMMAVMGLLGFSFGSIYHIVNITCCADLGKEQVGKSATATIAGIVDGFGSVGTATGMLLLGYFIQSFGYQYGFLLVITFMITLTLVPLSVVMAKEIRDIQRAGQP